jgi:hypothetical protein
MYNIYKNEKIHSSDFIQFCLLSSTSIPLIITNTFWFVMRLETQ